MSELTIYQALIRGGMTPAGAAGLMGNMRAESAMRANNAQDGMTSMSDEAYTEAVDSGAYMNFANDSVGYGLCQWTYPSRKKEMLRHARAYGSSIGDEAFQVEWTLYEMSTSYRQVYDFLCTTDSVEAASNLVCYKYEQPAINNTAERAQYAMEFYNRFAKGAEEIQNGSTKNDDPGNTPAISNINVPLPCLKTGYTGYHTRALQTLLQLGGYRYVQVNGVFDRNTLTGVKAFQHDHDLEPDGVVGGKTWQRLIIG